MRQYRTAFCPFQNESRGQKCRTRAGLGATRVGSSFLGAPRRSGTTLDVDNVPYRVGLDWRPSDSSPYHLNVAGRLPTLSASTYEQDPPVTQESVPAYEADFNSAFDGQILQLQSAAFCYAYQAKQIRTRSTQSLECLMSCRTFRNRALRERNWSSRRNTSMLSM